MNCEKEFTELELLAVDLSRSAENLHASVRRLRNLQRCNLKDVPDRDELIQYTIDELLKKLRGSDTLEKREKRVLKQLLKKIRTESK